MSARAFESYLISKLQDQNASNDYLANIVDEKTWKAAESLGFELDDSYPYPNAGEIPSIRAAFDKFFQTVETKEEEGRVAMYSVRPNRKEGSAITETPAFKKWFGDSVVTDNGKPMSEGGEPLVVYHGTKADFSSFDGEMSNSSSMTGVPAGVFTFSTSPEAASSYAGRYDVQGWDSPENEARWQSLWDAGRLAEASKFQMQHYGTRATTFDSGGRVIPAYVSVRNPLVVDAAGASWKEVPWRGAKVRTNDLIEYARRNGRDGLVIKNVRDQSAGTDAATPADTIFAFNPEQIKSAIGNNGDFDPSNPDIRYSVEDGKTVAEFGPVHTEYKDDPKGAIERLMQDRTGEAIVSHPDLGEISLIYGNGRKGLSHIAQRHGENFVTERLPRLFETGTVYAKDNQNGRVFLGNDKKEATIRLDWNGEAKAWLVSAYEKHPDLNEVNEVRESRRSEVIDERTEKPLTKDELRSALKGGVIGPVIEAMINNGVVVLHDTSKTLPKNLGNDVRGIQAVTAPNGKIHLVANTLTKNNARAVMLHEMFHKGGKGAIGSEQWSNLMGRGASLYRQARQSTGRFGEFWKQAEKRVAAAKNQNAVATRMEVEEFLAYAIEEWEQKPESLPAVLKKWVEDIIGHIKAALVKIVGKQIGEVTPAQLAAFAKFALMDVAVANYDSMDFFKDARYSARKITELPAFKKWFGKSKVVDENGDPLLMYHGTSTDKDFAKFKVGARGAWFTSNQEVASEYAEQNDSQADRYNPDTRRYEKVNNSGRVVPVYLKIEKPYRLTVDDARRVNTGNYAKAQRELFAEIKAKGYDGILWNDNLSKEWVALGGPEQIKSAIGNNGDFDPSNPDIRYSVAPTADSLQQNNEPPADAGLTPAEQGRLKKLQGAIQDNLNRLKEVQDRIKKLTGREDLGAADHYRAEINRPGRIAARIEDAKNSLFEPLMQRLAKAGKTPQQLEELLHAMHAQERNENRGKLHPEDSNFFKAINDHELVGASGMATGKANEILAQYKDDRELHAIAQQARDIARATLDLKHAYGLIDSETRDTLTKAYKNYIPLKGDGEYGPKIKSAIGHETREEHVLENISRDHDQAIVAGEKNLARQSLLRMILEFPDDSLWTARVPPKGRYIAGQTYYVRQGGKTVASFDSLAQASAYFEGAGGTAEIVDAGGGKVSEFTKPLQDNEVMVYVKGQPVRLQIHDETLAKQLRPLDQARMHPVLEFMRTANRYFSKIYTGYNPSFILRNAVRDALTGTINVTGTQGAAVAAKTWGNYPQSLSALAKWAATKKTPEVNIGDYLTQYRMHGGKTGASWLSDLEEQGKTLTRMYEDAYGVNGYMKDGKTGKAALVAGRKIVSSMAHVVEIGNQATENALRLALFITLREQGVPAGKAAQAAKSVTVDFDRKGTATGALGAIYLFFNPAVQGTANAFHTLTKGKHKTQAWAALGSLALLGMYAASQGMDDDKDRWLGEGWETRSKQFMLSVGGRQIRVPISYEFAPAYGFGVAMAEAMRGESKIRSAAHIVSSFIDAYFPLQGAYIHESDNHALDLALAVTPTIIKPQVQIATNRNSFGSQMVPESDFTKERPDNLKMFRGTKNSAYDATAQGIASLGQLAGAGAYENDITKVSPETLKHLWRTYTGGLGTFVSDSVGVAAMTAEGPGQVEASDVPIVKDFIRREDVKPLRSRYYNLAREAKSAISEFQQAKKAGDGEAMDAIFSRPEKAELLGFDRMLRTTGKSAAAVRDLEVEINADKSLTRAQKREKLREAEQEEESIYRSAIEALKR
jgi:hypothetical protein